jgi:excisionase family DNA binding protein
LSIFGKKGLIFNLDGDRVMKKTKKDAIEQLMTVEEVARLLNVCVRTVWRLDKKEDLPAAIRVGHSKRWHRRDIENWIRLGCPKRKDLIQNVERESQ